MKINNQNRFDIMFLMDHSGQVGQFNYYWAKKSFRA